MGPVRQHRHVRRHHHVPRYCWPYAEGDHRPRSLHHQDQDHRSPREEVLRLDRRIHPGLPLHLPADVDLQAGVRRVRPRHCPPQVLLSFSISIFHFCIHSSTNRSNGVGPIPFIFVLNMQLFVSNGSITCLRILTLEIHFFFSFQFFFFGPCVLLKSFFSMQEEQR